MREILFRGKRKDNGEWEYGDAFHNHDGRCFVGELVATDVSHNRFCDKYEIGINFADVDPETVGQYTGLNDTNGKKIFEGDILKRTNGNKYLWYVDFKLSAFCANQSNCNYACELGELLEMIELEIIGNIHDNPELLEVSDGSN